MTLLTEWVDIGVFEGASGQPAVTTAEAMCQTEEAQQSTVDAAAGSNSEMDRREAREEAVREREVQSRLRREMEVMREELAEMAREAQREKEAQTLLQSALAAARIELDEVRERARAIQEKLATAAAFIGKAAKSINGITQKDAKEAICDAIQHADFFGSLTFSESILTDTEWHIRGCAVRALGDVADRGSPQAMAIIGEAIEATEWPVRSCATKALGKVGVRGSPEAMAIVGKALKDRNWTVRQIAVTVLGEVADHGMAKDVAIRKRQAMENTEWCVQRWKNPKSEDG